MQQRNFEEVAITVALGPQAAAIGYVTHRSRSHDAVIRVYDDAGNVIKSHEHASKFKEW